MAGLGMNRSSQTGFSKQQQETLSYFSSHADQWWDHAKGGSPDAVNIIQQRNDYALHVISGRATTQSVLDIGCGSGDLVLDVARAGIRAVGVDFASEMIELARNRASEEHLPLAEFHCRSIFDFELNNPAYHCIAANGFIEYISVEQLKLTLRRVYQALNLDGSLVLGCRNRLFNLFSLNEFTSREIEEGSIEALLQESIALANGTDIDDLLTLEPAPIPRSETKQVNTGIDVSVRLQYTPVQLMGLLREAGFDTVDVSAIHIHPAVPRFKDSNAQVHTGLSTMLHKYSLDHRELIPQASSFMIHGRKSS